MELVSHQTNLGAISMKDLMAKTEFELPKPGSVIEGKILSVSKNSVLIDLGALGTGMVYPGEFYDNTDLQKSLKADQRVSTILLDIEDENGHRELSLKRAQMTTAWQDIKNKKDSGEVITTRVVNINKGGLIIELNGIQGFLPLSQLSPEHYPKIDGGDTTKIVQALQKLRNTEIQVKIIDFLEEENRLIVSERAINDEQLKQEVGKYQVGDVVEGEITDVTDFGAFVKISGSLEGLIHISEIDWKLIDNPRDFLKPGDKVQTKIISIEGTKISLSLKALKPNPWDKAEERYSVGQTVEGEVGRITNYGVFIRLDGEITGLIPTSEFGDKKPSEVLKIGDKQKVAIVTIEPKEHKMLLTLQSKREAVEEKNEPETAHEPEIKHEPEKIE
ncbi:MAG: S1 RNA-binding domain-containing protein [Minisyncoccia bacterium]